MKVTNVERVLVDVPFTPRQQQITTQSVSTVYNWSILELCQGYHGYWACRLG